MPFVFIDSFPTSPWQSNCYVIANNPGGACVVVDPGPDALPGIVARAERHGLKVAGVLLTHGHFDHVGDAAAVASTFDVPTWIHPADEPMLTQPLLGIGPAAAPLLRQVLGREEVTLPLPADVRHLDDTGELDVAGMEFAMTVAPGHTPGCVLLEFSDEEGARYCLSGDVLFAGSIGRTDLPGGSEQQMFDTLAHRVATLAPDTHVLPGHGPSTTIARELASNPYLKAAVGGLR